MAVDRVQDGEKDSRNFLPLSHCSSRVAFPRVHFCQRVTIYDTATVTGLCAATAAAAAPATRRRHGRQPRRIFQVLVAVQSTILTVTNDSTTLPYFQKTYYYTLQRENDAFYFVISSEFERGGQRHLPSFFKRSALEQLC